MKNLLGIPILFISSLIYAQPTIQWQKAYGGSALENLSDIEQTADGGYIFIGTTGSSDGDITAKKNNSDMWVVKTDATGAIAWEKCYGGDSIDFGVAIEQTTDGGYMLLGTTSSTNGDVTGNKGNSDIWLVKINATGTISWQKTYGGTDYEIAKGVNKTNDGGYIILGYSLSSDGDVSQNKGGYDVWVVKTDGAGAISWEKSYGGSSTEYGYCIANTADGGYIISGETTSNDGNVTNNYGLLDGWLFRISSTGSLTWQKTYGGSMNDGLFSVGETTDGGFIVAGRTNSNDHDVSGNHGATDAWAIKTNSTGDITWQKALGGSSNDFAWHVQQLQGGEYLIAAQSMSADGDVSGLHGPSGDMWAIELYHDGTFKWRKAIGGTSVDNLLKILQTSDGGYMAGGATFSIDGDATNSGNHGAYDIWLVKLTSVVSVNNMEQNSKINVYATLTDGVVNIELERVLENAVLHLYNTTGQLIQKNNTTGLNRTINLSPEPPGVYILQVSNNEYSFKYKIVNAPR